MRNIIITTAIAASICASTAFANDGFDSTWQSPALQNFNQCFEADKAIPANRAIRACTKALKESIPSYEIKSDLLTQRGFLQLTSGKIEKASRDFKKAAQLSNENEIAYLGQGLAAMENQDYETAISLFNDCKTHNTAAPLAYYSLGMAKELSGDKAGALKAFQHAAELRPDWEAPREELVRFNT